MRQLDFRRSQSGENYSAIYLTVSVLVSFRVTLFLQQYSMYIQEDWGMHIFLYWHTEEINEALVWANFPTKYVINDIYLRYMMSPDSVVRRPEVPTDWVSRTNSTDLFWVLPRSTIDTEGRYSKNYTQWGTSKGLLKSDTGFTVWFGLCSWNEICFV